MNDIHNILFNAHILFSIALGVWSAVMASRNQPISGNFWGSVATITGLAAIILLVGIILTIIGYRPPRLTTYYLYMAWLLVIMPGLFTLLRGRDDRSAAIAFSILSFFNAVTSFSMIVGVLGSALLAGCEAEPTPLPVIIAPTVTATAPPPDALRYALAPNAVGLIPELSQIEASALVVTLETLPTELDPAFDLVVALGDHPGWQQSPTRYSVALMIDITQPPLDDPALQAIVRRAAVPLDLLGGLDLPGASILKNEPVGDLRADLANAGYPDGFDATLTALYAPGIEPFASRLRQVGINVQIVTGTPADLTLVSASGDPARIDLFSVPISYLVNPALHIEFAPSGFPLANPP